MPQQLGAPGVYIEEIPSGRRVIRSVATSIAAFVDFFPEGPVDEPVQIFGTGDFQRIFGGFDRRSEASFQIPQFFLNGGTEAWVVRVVAEGEDADSNPLVPAAASVSSQNLTITAASEGAWGNTLRVEIDHAVAEDHQFNMRVIRFASTDGNAPGLLSETYLNVSMNEDDPRYVQTVVNDASQLVEVTVNGGTRPDANGTVGIPLEDGDALNQAAFDALGGDVEVDMSFGTASATATLSWAANDVQNLEQLRRRLEQAIRMALPAGQPAFSGARVFLEGTRLRVIAGRGGAAFDPTEDLVIADAAASDPLGLSNAAGATQVDQQHVLIDGADGVVPGPAELLGSDAVEPPTGMRAFDNVDLFNILCLPRAAELTDTERNAVYSQAISYCEERRAMVIVDLPPGTDRLQEMTDLMADLEAAGYRSENAAIFYPRVQVPDPTNDFRLRAIGSSGTMAGVWARIDTTRGVWKAPAGIETSLEGVSQLEAQLNDGQNGVINPLGINALRTFPVFGTIAWGSRTLVGADALASEWQYIPVRRLALMLEESLFRGTQWVVFEPNDEPTWANIRLNVGAFMNGLFQQGAFQGATPREAYYVKCDSETTTQNDIDAGIVNIEVGFAPLKPAEFVVIRFRQIVGAVET